MHLMTFCLCFFFLKFLNDVKGQGYNLTGSSKFAVLGEAFTWTCDMFVPDGQTAIAVNFKRNNLSCSTIGFLNSTCTPSTSNFNYTYACLQNFMFTLTISAESMTEYEQKSYWRCEYVWKPNIYRSPDMVLNIAIDVNTVTLDQINSTLKMREGAQRNVTCLVNSNAAPPPIITWYLNTTEISTEEHSSSVIIIGKRKDNKKTLQCRATNNQKPFKAASTILDIEYPPSVNKLNGRDIKEGDNLSVSCDATPGNPNSMTVYWTKVDDPGFRQNGIFLQLPYIHRNSSGTYKCTAENRYNNKENGTDNQTMIVNVLYPPSVKTLSNKDILEGMYLSVPCETTPGNPNSTTIYWTKVGEPEFRQSGATLQLANINRTSSGTYRCTAENNYSYKEKGTDSQSMVINVQYPPVVDTLYKQDIIEGRNLSVTCTAIPGNPNSTIFYWTKIEDSRFIQNGTMIHIPNIQRDRSGTYICIAENNYINGGKGTHNHTMVINVQYQPSIEYKPRLIVNESDMVTLTREISCNPLSNVSWYNGSQFLAMQTSVNTSTYVIGRASCTDTKNYTMIASNGILSEATSLVELIVNCKPIPDTTNITLGVTDTTGIEFSTKIIAYPDPRYELKYDNGTNNTQMTNMLTRNAVNSFTIHYNQTVVDRGDYGTYRLIVSNSFGETIIYVNILPQRKPDSPKSIKVTCDVTSASMEWEPSFNGGDQQIFTIFALNGQHGTRFSESIKETGENAYSHSIHDLEPSTLYEFYVSAQNKHGNSSSEKISCTTLEESSENLPLIVGVATAGGITLAIAFIIAVVFLRRFSRHEKQGRKSQRLKNEVAENEEENDDGMKDNILYVSAGPKVDEKPEAAVYAAVNKKAPESNNNANVYAEVKKSGHISTEGALYSDVKPKKGLFKKDVNRKKDGNPKQKKGKKQKNNQDVTDVYENSEDIPMSSKGDNVYSNTGQKVHNKEERGYKNKDGLLYVEVQFDAKTEKGNQTIHGEDEKTDYATVEFPMAASTHDE